MKLNEKHLSLRIEEGLLQKFSYVAGYDDRSMNKMLLSMIRKCVGDFEKEHGEIPPQKSDEGKNPY